MNGPHMETARSAATPRTADDRPNLPEGMTAMATTITQSSAPDPQDTFPKALAADLLERKVDPSMAPDLAEFFGLAGDMGDEFVTAMQRHRLDAAMAAIETTPAQLSWARHVLGVHEATGSAAIAVASAPPWPAS